MFRQRHRTGRTVLYTLLDEDAGQKHHVMIVDCGGDEAVKSRIIEGYDGPQP